MYCRVHYELILQSEAEMEAVGVSSGMSFPPLSPATPRLAFYNGVGAAQKGRPRKRKPNEDMPPLTPLTPGMGESVCLFVCVFRGTVVVCKVIR